MVASDAREPRSASQPLTYAISPTKLDDPISDYSYSALLQLP